MGKVLVQLHYSQISGGKYDVLSQKYHKNVDM